MALVISGIAGNINPGSISQTAVNLYNCGFILSFTGAGVTYYVLCMIWPVQVYPAGPHEHERREREDMVPTEGFFTDDQPLPIYIKDKMLFGEEPAAEPVDFAGHFKEKS